MTQLIDYKKIERSSQLITRVQRKEILKVKARANPMKDQLSLAFKAMIKN